jgi:hypothetical protein
MEERSNYKSEYSELRRIQEMIFGRKKEGLPIEPYFVYEIKESHNPYHLCFPENPTKVRYENDIFNLLATLPSVGEAINCLKYHLERYPSREDFLDFFRYELAARIQKSKSSERSVIYTQCLEWVRDQSNAEKENPAIASGETEISTDQKEKLTALFKFILREMDNSKPLDFGFYATYPSIAALLSNFSPFKKYKSSTLTKEVTNCRTEEYLSDELREALRKYFK